jgi:hypothetical protein
MNLKTMLHIGLLACCLAAICGTALADNQRSPSAEGASIAFANLADGDVVPPGYIAKFTISGMGIAPAGSEIENTGHFHLLIDLAELPPLDQPLPATDQIVHFGKGQSETTLDLTEGRHRLQLLLADYAHVAHDPPVLSEVITITVTAGG